MLRILIFIAGAYLLLLLALFIFQRQLIYLPFRRSEPEMLALAARLGLAPWRNDRNEIIGWKEGTGRGSPPANRLVVFHGNAGFALARFHFVDGFGSLDQGRLWDVYLFEYPGFGARSGALGQKAMMPAVREAIRQLRAEDNRPIFLLGESLGSGPACVLADEPGAVAGLFLITPYDSLADVAQHHYRFVPVKWMLRDRWENRAALRDARLPLAILLAEHDEIIPVVHGRRLFESAHEPKRLWVIKGATHNGLPFERSAPWWREVSDFLLSHPVQRPTSAGAQSAPR